MSGDSAQLKDEGNAFFRDKKFEEAIEKYSEALDATSDNVARSVLYSNRSQCLLSLERYQGAAFDAAEALIADVNNHKSWLRFGRAYVGLGLHLRGVLVLEHGSRTTQDIALAGTLRQAARDAKKQGSAIRGREPELPAPSVEHVARSVQLKDEGNNFATSQPPDFAAAYTKFSVALVFDPTSAAIHCNRAFCANSLKEFEAAEADARYAMRFDKKFVKAWARLGAAKLGRKEFSAAQDAFNHALQLLNDASTNEPLSPADTRLKASIEQSLKDSRKTTRIITLKPTHPSQLPWVLAEQIHKMSFTPALKNSWYSSTWMIIPAYLEYIQGVELLYQTRRVGDLSYGPTGAIQSLTNGLITDHRAFYVADRPDFYDRFRQQASLEAQSADVPAVDSAQALMEAVRERLQREGGWSSTTARAPLRRSVATTIRTWFLTAFLYEKLSQDYTRSLEVYTHIIDFLEMGRREWAGTHREERGAVFELTFLLGLKRHYANCLRERYLANVRMELPNAELLERIKSNAESMLEQTATFDDAARVPNGTNNKPSSVLPFMIYPEAVAHEHLGFYWYRKAKASATGNFEDMHAPLEKSIEHLAQAAELYPRDDEMCAEVLWDQVVYMCYSGHPLRDTLPVCDSLEQAMQEKQKIWRDGANTGTDERYKTFVRFAKDARDAVERGELTMESQVMPENIYTVSE
ncbi:TPR-like protein [Exidia glandulosa HHB12029]|uniref:TPR-like protein n=1 Tax=Exidia glandulosa HHB12029 TaxID=1314781 RepID=A0A165NL58_EXIGL|nr:TPR-like protein [Exidia glandulosa HHB12029]